MELNNLRERTKFKYGDQNIPTPGKLCLFKLSEKYFSRENCPYTERYLLGEIKEYKDKLQLVSFNPNKVGFLGGRKSKNSTYKEEFIEYWIYIENIEKSYLERII